MQKERSIALVGKDLAKKILRQGGIRWILALIDGKLRLTEAARVSAGGERLVVENWQSARSSRDFVKLAHIQRYEFVLPLVKGLLCLDAGCGSGYGTNFLSQGAECVIGIDVSIEAIDFARRHYEKDNLTYLRMDVCDLGFHDESFDMIVSFDVLEHLDMVSQKRFVSELSRVLKVGGSLCVGCPNAQVSMGDNPHHVCELKRVEFQSLLEKYFDTVKILGQDISRRGRRARQDWYQHIYDLSYGDLVIVEEDCDVVFGLLAVCRQSGSQPRTQESSSLISVMKNSTKLVH